MNNICNHHKFGYCMLKDKCEKEHLKEECSEGSYCESITTCALRHPKMCKRIVMEGLCHFGNKCAYNHKRIYHSQRIHTDDVHSDVQKLKDEVDSLKNTIQSLFYIKEEAGELKKSVEDIKREIKLLSAANKAIQEQIKYIEEESDKESNGVDDKVSYKENKCCECSFVGNTGVSLKKHINTKHPPTNIKTNKSEEDPILAGIDEHYQIEFIEGEQVYACNICDEGFDSEDEIKEHIAVDHKDILIEISKNVDEREEEDYSEETNDTAESIMNDSELYAGFDEDGNRIVEDDHDE